MDDPTKDTIPRSAVEYCLRKETVNTNPDAYEAHERFMAYMDDPDISQFGHWMHSNGFNCALVSIAVDLGKIPSVTQKAEQPEVIRCKDCKHHWIHRCMDSMPTEMCELDQTFYDANVDFCSLAERREKGGE